MLRCTVGSRSGSFTSFPLSRRVRFAPRAERLLGRPAARGLPLPRGALLELEAQLLEREQLEEALVQRAHGAGLVDILRRPDASAAAVLGVVVARRRRQWHDASPGETYFPRPRRGPRSRRVAASNLRPPMAGHSPFFRWRDGHVRAHGTAPRSSLTRGGPPCSYSLNLQTSQESLRQSRAMETLERCLSH
jgi:hypothetical protein